MNYKIIKTKDVSDLPTFLGTLYYKNFNIGKNLLPATEKYPHGAFISRDFDELCQNLKNGKYLDRETQEIEKFMELHDDGREMVFGSPRFDEVEIYFPYNCVVEVNSIEEFSSTFNVKIDNTVSFLWLSSIIPTVNITIAIPTRGTLHHDLVLRLLEWQQMYPKNLNFIILPNVEPIDRARNILVEKVKEAGKDSVKADYLFFIDDDTVPPIFAIEALIGVNKDIVTGFTPAIKWAKDNSYWSYDYTVYKCTFDKEGELVSSYVPDEYGVVKADRVGGACLMIKMSVFEKIEKAGLGVPFDMVYEKSGKWLLSEDYNFCDKARKAGCEIWAHGQVRCKHCKVVELY